MSIQTEPIPGGVRRGRMHSQRRITCDVCGKSWTCGLGWDPRYKGSNWPFDVIEVGPFKREKVVCKSHTDEEIKNQFK